MHLTPFVSMLTVLTLAGTALPQTPTPTPTPLGGGVTGQAASYVPSIPLSARANQNLGGNAGLVYAQGMEFVRFSAVNNPPAVSPFNPNATFGQVTQEFAIGRFEVSRAVWVNFFDALVSFNQANPGNGVAWAQFPSGGRPTHVPGLEMQPVGGISWRTAAILCNWLHNDRAITREAFTTGVYDVSTFGWDPVNGRRFTDQREASPGARFRLPQWNEWTAAVHFDPNGNGPGQHRWWQQPLTSDAAPVYGLPGAIINGAAAQANSFTGSSGVLLGSYPTAQTPWGLLDAAGGMTEWMEDYNTNGLVDARLLDGSNWHFVESLDLWYSRGGDAPSIPDFAYGVRLIYVVPSPSSALLAGCLFVFAGYRRR